VSRHVLVGVVAVAGVVAAVALLLGGGRSGTSHAAGASATHSTTTSAPRQAGHAGAAPGHTTGSSGRRDQRASSPPTTTGATHAQIGAGGAATVSPGKAAAVAEVRDPEESKSFPLPASVRHRAASTPSVAAEAAVAPGAASDTEIRKELGEEEHAKAEERAAQNRVLTPVAGGFSVGGNGTIPIPTNVPEQVQRVIAGGNAIADFPYIWGGGHASFVANGYDCSGSVSYALAAGGLLSAPLVSGDLAKWGEPGVGRWITIYANAGHTFMDVDGVWFDTAGRSGPYASRWLVSQPSLEGYAVRHPPGL
jgi:cell wall-associated NlpC family hydrolase